MKRKILIGAFSLASLVALTWLASPAGASEPADAVSAPRGTAPPPEGWANRAPTRVEQAVAHETGQLLEVSQGELRTWIRVPAVGAQPGDYVLLGQGSLVEDFDSPVIDIAHVQVVDYATSERVLGSGAVSPTTTIAGVYADLSELEGRELVVGGTVVKAPNAIGSYWVHIQDGSGEAAAGTHDLTIKTSEAVLVGEYVVFRGQLRADVDLGFGYHYAALVDGGVRVGN